MAPEIDVARARAALQEVEATAVSLDMFSTEHQGDDKLPSVGQRRCRLRAGRPAPRARGTR